MNEHDLQILKIFVKRSEKDPVGTDPPSTLHALYIPTVLLRLLSEMFEISLVEYRKK